MDGHQLTIGNAISFLLAGDAIFTIVRPSRSILVRGVATEDPEKRFTYRVQRAKGDEGTRPWFVKVLTGPNNLSDYQYLGTIFLQDSGGVKYVHGRKSKVSDDAPSSRGIAWLVGHLNDLVEAKRELAKADALFGNPVAESKIKQVEAKLAKMEYYHVGRCGRCARPLTVPESILNGIGPDCAAKYGVPNVLDLLARNL